MVVIGGLTRLTGSGLSMVDWAPVSGWLPPFNEADWLTTFERYQQYPEFKIVNNDMSLEEFKGIFWLEFIHRLMGRLTGVVFLIPLFFFTVRKRVNRQLFTALLGVFILGALQGGVGWLMVKSGMVDKPHVSQYRLTAHLGFAFLIYCLLFWTALRLYVRPKLGAPGGPSRGLRPFSWFVVCMTFLTTLSGGFVAGLKAGFHFNTFPLMDGRWIPKDYLLLDPGYLNMFENIAAVQWNHRLLAILTFLIIALFWTQGRRYSLPPKVELGFNLLMGMGFIQISLGISTLLLYVPTPLASAHQAGALILLSLAINAAFLLQYRWRGLPGDGYPDVATLDALDAASDTMPPRGPGTHA